MVRQHGFAGSLFVNSAVYVNESECRIAFEMPADIEKPITLVDRSLLDFFEIYEKC